MLQHRFMIVLIPLILLGAVPSDTFAGSPIPQTVTDVADYTGTVVTATVLSAACESRPGRQIYAYTLEVGGRRFKAFKGVTLTPATFTLDPYGTQTLTITAERKARGFGFIVFYNLETGSVYSKTMLTVYRWRWR